MRCLHCIHVEKFSEMEMKQKPYGKIYHHFLPVHFALVCLTHMVHFVILKSPFKSQGLHVYCCRVFRLCSQHSSTLVL